MPSSRRSRRACSSGDSPRRLERLLVAVQLGEHQLADVVKEGRDGELVALRQPGHLADPLGADPHRDAVATEALVAARVPGWSRTS